MKKISTIMLIAGLSSFVFAQKGNSFSNSYNAPVEDAEADNPGGGGAGGTDLPIDDYIPVLATAGLGMAVYFGRKKYILTNK